VPAVFGRQHSQRTLHPLRGMHREYIIYLTLSFLKWLGGTLSFISSGLPMRFDFRHQCRRNWSTCTILCMVEMPLNTLFECWSWRHWMFVVPFRIHFVDSFRVPPNGWRLSCRTDNFQIVLNEPSSK
jgi:hypothetical protein